MAPPHRAHALSFYQEDMSCIMPTPYVSAFHENTAPTDFQHQPLQAPASPTTPSYPTTGAVSPPSIRVARAAARLATSKRPHAVAALPTDIWPSGERVGRERRAACVYVLSKSLAHPSRPFSSHPPSKSL